ncbi:MAG: hypothetical protein BRC48_08555 [Cyanobacteria bacterium QS_9_48_30]|nr:MAG: hypothetical protein BRC48_08555 [Cyanobacteria bacterium QS_9_48_30]
MPKKQMHSDSNSAAPSSLSVRGEGVCERRRKWRQAGEAWARIINFRKAAKRFEENGAWAEAEKCWEHLGEWEETAIACEYQNKLKKWHKAAEIWDEQQKWQLLPRLYEQAQEGIKARGQ